MLYESHHFESANLYQEICQMQKTVSLGNQIQEQYRLAYKIKTNQTTIQDVKADDKAAVSRMVDELTFDELQVGGWGFQNVLAS